MGEIDTEKPSNFYFCVRTGHGKIRDETEFIVRLRKITLLHDNQYVKLSSVRRERFADIE